MSSYDELDLLLHDQKDVAVGSLDHLAACRFSGVFLTGGSGFIGRALIRFLLEHSICPDISAIARSDHSEAVLRELGVQRIVRGDLSDKEALLEGMQGCEAVFHLAAGLEVFHKFYENNYEANVVGTCNVIEAAWKAGVRVFLHCSSEGVLAGGKQPVLDADESFPFGANSKHYPYSKTKQMAEQEVLTFLIDRSGDKSTIGSLGRFSIRSVPVISV